MKPTLCNHGKYGLLFESLQECTDAAQTLASAPETAAQRELLLVALKWIMRDFVGDRNAENCQGGEMFDAARTAIDRCSKESP